MFPAPAQATASSVAVAPGSVEGQSSPTATVTLTENAPAGGAAITLQSGKIDVAKVPSSVTVAAGQKTATFTVDTSTVPVDTQVTLQATYLGVTKLFVLTVRPPTLTPRFTVTSASKGTNACSVIDASGLTDCVFDSSTSGGFIANHYWTLKVGNTETTFRPRPPPASDAIVPEVAETEFAMIRSSRSTTCGSEAPSAVR